MKLNTFRQSFLQSWNVKQDKRVEFLISAVGWNIDSLLDTKGDINCVKIDRALRENTFKLPLNVLNEVKATVSRVRNTFATQCKVSVEIDHCNTFDEMVDVFKSYRKSLNINVFILNKVISKADNLDKALKIVSRYWKGIELNYETINILFKLSNSFKEKKDLLEKYWQWKPLDIYILNMMLSHAINVETFGDIISEYWEWLEWKWNVVTLTILLKNVLRLENNSQKKYIIWEVLNLFNILDLNFTDLDQVTLWKLVINSRRYYKNILQIIRQNKITQLYFLLPEQKN